MTTRAPQPHGSAAASLRYVDDRQNDSLSAYLGSVLDQLAVHVQSNSSCVLLWKDQASLVAYRGDLSARELKKFYSSPNLQPIFEEYAEKASDHALSNQAFEDAQVDYVNLWPVSGKDRTLVQFRKWLCLPILLNGQVLGFLSLGKRPEDSFSDQDLRIARSYVEIIAVPIHKEHLYVEAQRSAEEGQALISVQKALTSRLELDPVLQLIADEARRLTNARMANLMLVHGDYLRTSALSGTYSADVHIGYDIPLTNSLTGSSILLNRPVRVENAWNNPKVYRSDHLQVKSFISVPLISESKAIGAIMVADKLSGAFDEEDERIAHMLASSAVIAVENARLYRNEQERRLEADHRRRVAEGLQEILAILNSRQPLPDMLYQILRQACQLLGSQASAIARQDGQAENLKIQTCHGLPDTVQTIRDYRTPDTRSMLPVGKNKPTMIPASLTNTGDGFELSIGNVPGGASSAQSPDAAISVHLIVDGIAYGEMFLFYPENRSCSDEEIELAETVGHQVSLAIEKANLHQQAEDLARLQERQRIAQALHDSVAQMLFSLGMEVDKVLNSPLVDESLAQPLTTIRRLAARSSYELRSAIFALREGKKTSDKSGVVDLIEEVVAEFRVQTGIAITCISPAKVPNLQPGVTEAIYRIVRESLTNISKHSQASAVIVNLSHDEHAVHITIQDDGIGLQALGNTVNDRERNLHFGVTTMRQLAAQAHGDFVIMNGDEQGVLIKASFPISEEII